MKINEEKVRKLAILSQLNLDDDEIKKIFSDFKQIVSFVDKLKEVDTSNIEPLTHIHPLLNINRDDTVYHHDIKQECLNNSAHHNSDYFKVPKVLK